MIQTGLWISPTLWKIYLESVLYNRNKKCRNKQLPTGDQTICHLIFVDDEVIITLDKMQNI